MSATHASSHGGAHIQVRAVSHTFVTGAGALTALSDVSLDVADGEFVSVIGPSGCGKSTLLRLIAGLLPVQQGEVAIAGAAPARARRAKAIGFVSQDPALLPWRTVAENIRLATEVNRRAGGRCDADELLALVGLAGFARAYPHQLSGGMQQRAALARALATDPPLLLMDEPFGALDEITRTELRHELLGITARAGKTVVFVTHSIAEAVLLSHRVAVITARPGRLRSVINVDLPHPRTPDDEMTDAFLATVRRLRALLHGGAGRAGAEGAWREPRPIGAASDQRGRASLGGGGE